MHEAFVLMIDSGRQSGWTYLIVLGLLAVFVIAVWLIGKIFPSKAHTAIGNALMHTEVLFRPSRQHVIEAQLKQEHDDESAGDPPEPGQ